MLNKITVFRGINYSRIPYTDLEIQIQNMVDYGWDVHDLGYSSDDTKKLYGISLGDIENKPVIYFHGQIYGGHEWQTAHWVLEFCRQITHADNTFHRLVFSALKSKYAFYCIPCVNPYGYDPATSSYANANGVAIDANFDYHWSHEMPYYNGGPYPFSEPESLAIKHIFDTYKPLSLLCAHTHGGYSGIAIRPNTQDKYSKLMTHAIKSATISTDEWHSDGGEINRLRNRATAYNWAGSQQSRFGLPIPGCAVEPGSNENDYYKSQLGMTSFLVLIMKLDKYYRTLTQ